eukprot:2482358-Amphidinium_carterae.1
MQLQPAKLLKKVRDIFKRATKSLIFDSKPWEEVVHDYAEAVFPALFASLGDRSWLPQVDFLH